MSGAPSEVGDSNPRPVLVPAGNNSRPLKTPSKPSRNVESQQKAASAAVPKVLRRQEVLLRSNMSLNASCSSDCSVDSFRSRASTGRIRSSWSFTPRRRVGKSASKVEKVVPDGVSVSPRPDAADGKIRCPWVTPHTGEACYAAFHDEEWGVPVHDDKKLFELLVLCSALAELTWPAILSKRDMFRELFMNFDPVAVSKLNEKKIISQGSNARSLLSEPKLRAIIENSHQVVKIIEEQGSFDRYCWSFVNNKPIISRFRYPRQVPMRTPKADMISKDLMNRGFRSVGPTVVYTFMQVAGITNDHLTSCYRFDECCSPAPLPPADNGDEKKDGNMPTDELIEENSSLFSTANIISNTKPHDVISDQEFGGVLDIACVFLNN